MINEKISKLSDSIRAKIVQEIIDDPVKFMPAPNPRRETRCAGCGVRLGNDEGEVGGMSSTLVWVRDCDRNTVAYPPNGTVLEQRMYSEYHSFWFCENCPPIPDMAKPYMGMYGILEGDGMQDCGGLK